MRSFSSDTSETVVIIKLDELIRRLRDDGKDISAIGQFFDVGEWLIAFEGIENAFSETPIDDETGDKIQWLKAYFANLGS
ncbi:hypothetical protein E2F50_20235 [Rhizobium deserti]|uniref:Uncharacterized protein n=1 Tax=Rhizobium deserti TaxID=2547961 RepID=A0A4R5U9W9_9HYPH|nr:hypothetical protein [Rhizobium deserti]TDK31272.1 hypothetical protein E2F50_20235 [Rhizobium deserti]